MLKSKKRHIKRDKKLELDSSTIIKNIRPFIKINVLLVDFNLIL